MSRNNTDNGALVADIAQELDKVLKNSNLPETNTLEEAIITLQYPNVTVMFELNFKRNEG